MKILITGGTGFIGRHLVKLLKEQGHKIEAWDLEIQKPMYADWLCDDVQYSILDIRNSEKVHECMRNFMPDCVIHLAGKAGVRNSLMFPLEYTETNVVGTENVLNACVRTNVKRFVFASSSSVYGNPTMSSPEYGTNEHVSANRPISPYANTKRMGEMLCFMYTQVWGIETVALRLFTVYGPYGRRDMAITKFVRNMMLSLPIDVYGDPKTTYRDYTHVSDIVDGFAKACTYKMLTSNHTMNLGSNNPTTLETMIKTIEQHFGYQAVRNNMSMQKGDVVRTNAHIEEAEQKMGWSPRMSFERGIKDYVKWYRETMTPNLSSSELES